MLRMDGNRRTGLVYFFSLQLSVAVKYIVRKEHVAVDATFQH